jgi:hypothetical protein
LKIEDVDHDALFDEVNLLNECLSCMDDRRRAPVDETWVTIFKACDGKLSHTLKIVSKVLAIPISNAFIESVFSR